MSKRVLIINTGGTIGMAPTDQGLKPAPGLIRDVIMQSDEFAHDILPDFELYDYNPLVDSANVDIALWNLLSQDIFNKHADFDGFLILHGTDTMAYTASMLSYTLQNVHKPIILTGSQIPIANARNDAKRNLITALMLACHDEICEVALYFDDKLMRGNRTSKVHTDGFKAFVSPNYPSLATVGVEIQVNKSNLLPSQADQLMTRAQLTATEVAGIKMFPGMSNQYLEAIVASKPAAILIEAYGQGNLPNLDKAFIQILEQAISDNIYLAINSQCRKGDVVLGAYEASHHLVQLGALSCFDMTFEAAITKLQYLLSLDLSKKRFVECFEQSLVGELSRNP